MTVIRCSSLPLFRQCSASSSTPAILYDSAGDEARLGTAVHEALAEVVFGGQPDYESIATVHDVALDELRRLAGWGVTQWFETLHAWFDPPQTEVPLEYERDGLVLTGHLDVLSVAELRDGVHEARVLDWKTGRLDSDHDDQLRGYAWLSLQEYPSCQTAYVAVVRVRDRVIDGKLYTRAELDEWFKGIWERASRIGYNPGTHCRYCSHGPTCQAKSELLRQSADIVYRGAPLDLPADRVERGTLLARVLERSRMLRQSLEMGEDLIRAQVALDGGELPTDDGRKICLLPTEQRKILFRESWETLVDAVPVERWNDCFTVGKTAVEAVVKEGAARGQKGKAVAALMERLEADGAITTKIIERLEIKRGDSNSTRGEQQQLTCDPAAAGGDR